MYSLRFRVLATQALVLTLFFGLTLVGLDIAFRYTAERAVRDRLEVELLMLIAQSELGEEGQLSPPRILPEPRFSQPGSGLYGSIWSHDDKLLWHSPSAVGLEITPPIERPLGEARMARVSLAGEPVFRLSMSVGWEDNAEAEFNIEVSESQASFQAQLSRWRQQLGWWMGLSVALLLLTQLLTLRFLMRPLRRAEREIEAVERGELSGLSDGYPVELAGLSRNFNTLVANERARLGRYRDTLGNLAHSLKTPLAVMRNLLGGLPEDSRDDFDRQLETMDQLVSYQLRRAAASGSTTLGHKPMSLQPHLERVLRSLDQVYASAIPDVAMQVQERLAYRGDEGDLYEITGNLLDNAFKYGAGRIRVSAFAKGDVLVLQIADGGNGIEPDDWSELLDRGNRLDQVGPGQGIGLSVVREIAQADGGALSLEPSPLGGASIRVTLPGRAALLDDEALSTDARRPR
jgi:two-component system, OmpR family, sensor histidine kinase PhoQ